MVRKLDLHEDAMARYCGAAVAIMESVVRNFVRLVREFKNRPDGERVDYHRTEWRG